jgi:hypothetical protein
MIRLTDESYGMTRTYVSLDNDQARTVSTALEAAGIPHMLHRADRDPRSAMDAARRPVLRFLHTLVTDNARAVTIVDSTLAEKAERYCRTHDLFECWLCDRLSG